MNFLKYEFSKNINKNYLDLISKNYKFINDPFYLKTLNLWGKGIHAAGCIVFSAPSLR